MDRRHLQFRVLSLLALAGLTSGGCTAPRYLRHATIKQAETATDIHQQQVLDNLAKFVFDPNSIPSFSIASSGQANVTDNVSGGLGTLGFDPGGFASAVLNIGGGRQSNHFWSLTAVNNPRRLELMRCAYQNAVANCGRGGVSGSCPDCEKRFNEFYTGQTIAFTPYRFESRGTEPLAESAAEELAAPPSNESPADHSTPPTAGPVVLARDPLPGNLVPRPGDVSDSGYVTSNCLNPSCCQWFGVGCKKCVPRDCPCQYVGHYCGTYVWVLPGRGRDELAKLTLAILDYANGDVPLAPTKEVTLFRRVDSNGFEQPSTSDQATKVVRIVVAADDMAEQALTYPAEKNLLWPREETKSGPAPQPTGMQPAPANSGSAPPSATFRFQNGGLTPLQREFSSPALQGDDLTRQRIMIDRFAPAGAIR